LISELGIRRSLWLTATLPAPARREIVGALPPPVTELGGFALPEALRIHVVRSPWPARAEMLRDWALGSGGTPGIVFVGTREGTARVCRLLEDAGTPSMAYHAGLSREERSVIENDLRRGGDRVIVATSAFGLGMDYSHLRWAALWQSPPSVLALAQALGRVGRSHARGDALVLWDPEDFRLLEWTARGSERKKEELRRLFALYREPGCRRAALRRYFDPEAEDRSCGELCDVCGAA
jgi:ATP-dependent DNA helicase RecQ